VDLSVDTNVSEEHLQPSFYRCSSSGVKRPELEVANVNEWSSTSTQCVLSVVPT
jgi:hypothetical protein